MYLNKELTLFIVLIAIPKILSKQKQSAFPYSECGASFCFGLLESGGGDCIKKNDCKAAVIVRIIESDISVFRNYLHFEVMLSGINLKGASNWVAVGISDDSSMGNDSVVECFTKGQFSAVLRNSMNMPRVKQNYHVDLNRVNGTVFQNAALEGDTMVCSWKLERYLTITGQERDIETSELVGKKMFTKYINMIDKQYFILLAYGMILPGTIAKYKHVNAGSSDAPIRFDLIYANCEDGKGLSRKFCFGITLAENSKTNCIDERLCDIIVMITSPGNYLKIQIRVTDIRRIVRKASAYIAVGFSFDKNMGKDSVTECIYNRKGPHFIKDSFNNKRGENVASETDISFTRETFLFKNVFECQWNRPFKITQQKVDFNIFLDEFYTMVSIGEYNLKKSSKLKHRKQWITNVPSFFHKLKSSLGKECNDVRLTQCFGFIENNKGSGNCMFAGKKCVVRLKAFRTEDGYMLDLQADVGTGNWAAVAFSEDDKMGDDVVFECTARGSLVTGDLSWNTNDKKNVKADRDKGVSFGATFLNGKTIGCKFEIDSEFSLLIGEEIDRENVTVTFENTTFYNILLAYGKLDISSSHISKMQHFERVVMELPFVHVHEIPNPISELSEAEKQMKAANAMLVNFITAAGIIVTLIVVFLIVFFLLWNREEETEPNKPNRYITPKPASKARASIIDSTNEVNKIPSVPQVTHVPSDITVPVKTDALFASPRLSIKGIAKSKVKGEKIKSGLLFKRSGFKGGRRK